MADEPKDKPPYPPSGGGDLKNPPPEDAKKTAEAPPSPPQPEKVPAEATKPGEGHAHPPKTSVTPEGPKASPEPATPGVAVTPPKPGAPTAAGGAPPPKPAAPKPTPAPPKEGPVALDNEMTKRYRERFGEAIREAWIDRKQAIIVVAAEKWLEVTQYTRDEEKFNLLSDLTAVDWPKREKRFDVLCNLYSFEKNERVRLKTHVADGASVASVAGVWPTANWLERECFDMFGIRFEGHPNLHRILLPEEWQGYPLRKDYDILTQDEKWVKENLGIDSGQ